MRIIVSLSFFNRWVQGQNPLNKHEHTSWSTWARSRGLPCGIGQHETDVFNSFHPHFFDRPNPGWKNIRALARAARHSTFFPEWVFTHLPVAFVSCGSSSSQHPYLKTHSFFMQLKNPLCSQCALRIWHKIPTAVLFLRAPLCFSREIFFSRE